MAQFAFAYAQCLSRRVEQSGISHDRDCARSSQMMECESNLVGHTAQRDRDNNQWHFIANNNIHTREHERNRPSVNAIAAVCDPRHSIKIR